MTGPTSNDPRAPVGQAVVTGACPLVTVQVEGREVQCLLDTGSQVTLFSETLCTELFGNTQNACTNELPWLTLRAANGLKIPYIGYVTVDFQIGGTTVPSRGVVIVRDNCLGLNKAILGMNVISACWQELFSQPSASAPTHHHHSLGKEWDAAFADCHRIHATSTLRGKPRTARLAYSHGISIPAQAEALLWAKVANDSHITDCTVVVEPLAEIGLVEVARSLATVRRGRVPIRVRNIQPHPVTLSKLQRLAVISAVDPGDVRDGRDISLNLISPDVVEVQVVQLGQESPGGIGGLPPSAAGLKGEELDSTQQQQLQQLLSKWQHVFAQHSEDYGRTAAVKHQIPTGNAAPIRERYRPVPPTLYKEIRSLLQGMLEGGVIRESCSPWAAPIVLVQKKCGAWRFCVDYRKLNSVTHKDAFPLPRIEDSLTNLSAAEWYSTLDLASGYWQVEVDEPDREKTAFTTPFGLFEFERMPFGLTNGPATFQRLMQRCLGSQLTDSALVYLDDVILYSRDFNTHLQDLERVFQAMGQYGLKLRLDKCHLFRKQVKFLGHLVSGRGVAPDPDKLSAVQNWEPPTTVRQVRAFLGFVGYYRRFIKGFSKIAKPLNELLVGTGRSRSRSSPPVNWTQACESAFHQLKQQLLEAPVLAYANFESPFILYTDASNCGLGAVLAQQQDGIERVIAYASRSLHPAERNDANYSSFKLELLALKWALVEKFKDYVWGAKIVVVTDNSPLVHLHTARLGPVEQRWVAQLASFDYTIKYRPGKDHVNADVLSRFQPTQVDHSHDPPPEQELLVSAVGVHMGKGGYPEGWGWDPVRWKTWQEQDPALQLIGRALTEGRLPKAQDRKKHLGEVQRLFSQWNRLSLRDGVICRHVQDSRTNELYVQIVVPAAHVHSLWEAFHQHTGHQGLERTLYLLRKNFYWGKMESSVRGWIQTCPRCVLRKSRPEGKAPLVPILPSAPMEILAIDFLTLGRPTDRFQNILVMTDLFTKYAWAVPTADQTAITTARALWSQVIQPFGCPEKIHSDQGANFESDLIYELCQLYGAQKSRTTPYHPQGNGGCERMNQTLLNLLGTLEEDQQTRWADYLPALIQAYNNSIHSSTGYAPTYLMLGRHVRLPVELLMGTVGATKQVSTAEWVARHHEHLTYAYSKTCDNMKKAAEKNKRLYDLTAKDVPFVAGERVLVLNRRKGNGKLRDKWDHRPYVVLGQDRPNHPVYRLRPEGAEGPIRILHRNHLRPCLLYPTPDPQEQGEIDAAPQAPIWGFSLPRAPAVQNDADDPESAPRRSQRANLGNPPERYGH